MDLYEPVEFLGSLNGSRAEPKENDDAVDLCEPVRFPGPFKEPKVIQDALLSISEFLISLDLSLVEGSKELDRFTKVHSVLVDVV